jgi:hypothetical protein
MVVPAAFLLMERILVEPVAVPAVIMETAVRVGRLAGPAARALEVAAAAAVATVRGLTPAAALDPTGSMLRPVFQLQRTEEAEAVVVPVPLCLEAFTEVAADTPATESAAFPAATE